jgi:hypothetical protein
VAIEPDRFRELVDAYGQSIADCALARDPPNSETLEVEVPRACEALMKHFKAALQKAEQTGRETGRESIAKELAESKAESAKMQKSYDTDQKKWEKSLGDHKRRVSEMESRGATVIVEREVYKRKVEDEEKNRKERESRTKRALAATKQI